MTPTRRSVAIVPVVAIATAAALLLPVGPLASADQPRLSLNTVAVDLVAPAAPPAGGAPTLDVTTYLDEVDIPWDVAFVGDVMLVTERDQERILARFPGGETRVLSSAPAGMWHQGETGLMGIAVDPAFAENRRIYTCHGYSSGGTTDIRVVRWGINEAFTAATQQANVITGIQIVTGRHGGCRLRFAGNGALFVGTGDSAVGVNPQSLTSPNGKTLRVIAGTGAPWPGNPFFDAANQVKRTIYTYGHRNVQGLALRKGNQMWSAEHGPDRDDEVNKLKAGSNYGWNPVPGYDESVPMTDHSLPGRQIDARWSSGSTTIATSGMAWLKGNKWGSWEGRLAVAALAGSELRLLEFSTDGQLISQLSIAEFDGDFGRLRAVQLGPHRNLFVTTSNGGGNDRVLKVKPQA